MPCPAPTARLSFRELWLVDVDNLQTIFSDPQAMEHYPSTKDAAETEKWIAWQLGNYERCGHGLWAVSLRHECVLAPSENRWNKEGHVYSALRRAG